MGTPATLVTVRMAQPEDAPGIGRVSVLAWQSGYAKILPTRTLARLDAAERAESWAEFLTRGEPGKWHLVAETHTGTPEIIGIASYGSYRPAPDDDATTVSRLCELHMLNVVPDHWGRGVANALHNRSLEGLGAEYPRQTPCLWVLQKNGRARHFYEKHAWESDGASKTVAFADEKFEVMRYIRMT